MSKKSYPCCKCCPGDPIFHEDNPPDSHEIPCDACALDARMRPVIEGLIARLETADARLKERCDEIWEPVEREHLAGKASGVRLARSYAEELLR